MAIPFVPVGPGVPTLPSINQLVATADIILTDLLSFGENGQQWGLFLDGVSVMTADSVLSFEIKQNYRIATFAIEPSNQQSAGGFESYNKVALPFDVHLRFATGGTPADREELLEQAEAICASLDLFDAVTPERVYQSVNPTHFDCRRTAHNGVAMITIDLFCEQVRTTAASSFTTPEQSGTGGTASNNTVTQSGDTFDSRFSAAIVSPASASASPTVSSGTVQASQATPAQQTAADGVLAQSMLPF